VFNGLTFKDDVDVLDIDMIHPAVMTLIGFYMTYCYKHNLHCEITSLIHDREGVIAKSKTHEEGRAVDVSVKGWSREQISDFVNSGNIRFSNIGAISTSDNKARAFVYHNGNGWHIHAQIKRLPNYKLCNAKENK